MQRKSAQSVALSSTPPPLLEAAAFSDSCFRWSASCSWVGCIWSGCSWSGWSRCFSWDVYGQDARDAQDALRWDPLLGREGLLQGGPALRWEEAGGKEGWWSSWSTKTEHKLSRLKTVDTDTLRMQLSVSQVSLKCTHLGLSLSQFLEVQAAQSWIEGMRHS